MRALLSCLSLGPSFARKLISLDLIIFKYFHGIGHCTDLVPTSNMWDRYINSSISERTHYARNLGDWTSNSLTDQDRQRNSYSHCGYRSQQPKAAARRDSRGHGSHCATLSLCARRTNLIRRLHQSNGSRLPFGGNLCKLLSGGDEPLDRRRISIEWFCYCF